MLDVVCAGLLAAALVRFLIFGARCGWRWIPVDHPNARSLHDNPVPRGGGLAVLLSVFAVAAISVKFSFSIAPAMLLLTAISYRDDLRSLPASLRLSVHFAAGLWFAASIGGEWWQFASVTLILAAAANITNFMDGANGLVGGVMLICFGAMGLFAAAGEQYDLATICFATAGATAGFLIFNVPGGRIFLGDAGSVPLGFLGAAISFIGIEREVWPPSVPLLLFMPLYADALLTLIRRLLRGERVWEAHREHAYQRLVQSGWPHHRVAAVYVLATLITAVLGAASTNWNRSAQLTMLLSCVLVLFLLLSAIHHRWRIRQDAVSPNDF